MNDLLQMIRNRLKNDLYPNKEAIKIGIIIPLLSSLGWDCSNPRVVIPDLTYAGHNIDFVLKDTKGLPRVFIYCTDTSEGEISESPMFDFDDIVYFAVKTDGNTWRIYFAHDVNKMDLLSSFSIAAYDLNICENILRKFLQYQVVCDHLAIHKAVLSRDEEITEHKIFGYMNRVWVDLVEGSSSVELYKLFQKRVCELYNYNPTMDECSNFIWRKLTEPLYEENFVKRNRNRIKAQLIFNMKGKDSQATYNTFKKTRKNKHLYRLGIGDTTYEPTSLMQCIKILFTYLQAQDSSFLQRLHDSHTKTTSNNISKDVTSFCRRNPANAKETSIALCDGWWLKRMPLGERTIAYIKGALLISKLAWGKDVTLENVPKRKKPQRMKSQSIGVRENDFIFQAGVRRGVGRPRKPQT